MDSIDIFLPENRLGLFTPLLSRGIGFSFPAGISIRKLLCGTLGLDPVYVDSRVQTIFLNGKAVDDIERANVEDGGTLALSAAMPGLVGATFRRDGRYASMRASVSLGNKENESRTGESGVVQIKCFNLVAAEIGPRLMARRFCIFAQALFEILNTLDQKAIPEMRLELNGRAADLAHILGTVAPENEVLAAVNAI